jgi:threonyl-tRNA synthetase
MTDLERIRHSAAHVLATALLKIWPEAQLAAGPPVETGFYYDVDLPHRISPADFERIEAEMKAVTKANQPFVRSAVSREEAIKLGESGRLAALGTRAPSKFKLDILRRIPEGEEISLYTNGDFVDLCAGPHVMRTGNVGAFKLTHVSSTYYLGDEKNPQLQRIYGTAFKNKTEMEAHFNLLEEAKKRDHRKLGPRAAASSTSTTKSGRGSSSGLPNGAIIRQELQNFISRELTRQGYSQVFTPHIGKLGLYRTSGHFPYYKESQYPPIVERETLDLLAKEGCTCAELSNKLDAARSTATCSSR